MDKGKPVSRARWMNAAQALAAILLAVMVNVVAVRLAARYPLSADLTANARYSLSQETRSFLSGLEKDVTIRVLAREAEFISASRYTAYAASLLKQYPVYGPVHVEYVDYLRDPSFAAAYAGLALQANGLVVSCEGRSSALGVGELFEYFELPNNEMKVTAVLETRVAEAIASVYSETRATAGLLSGNGAKPALELRSLLEKNGYRVNDVPLTAAVFDTANDVLFLAAPTTDLTAEQVGTLEAYLTNAGEYGRTLFYAADVAQSPLPNLEGFLREWGVGVDDGAVFETSSDRTSQSQPFFTLAEFTDEGLRKEFAGADAPVLIPMARPLTLRFQFQEGYAARALLQFSSSSGVRPSNAPATFNSSDAVRRGPIPAIVLSTLTRPGKAPSRVCVSASTALMDDAVLRGNAFLNRRLLLHLFSGFGPGADLSNFTGKEIDGARVHIPGAAANTLGILLAVVLPLLLFGAGVLTFVRRRRL